jgi:hypothetical protein
MIAKARILVMIVGCGCHPGVLMGAPSYLLFRPRVEPTKRRLAVKMSPPAPSVYGTPGHSVGSHG